MKVLRVLLRYFGLILPEQLLAPYQYKTYLTNARDSWDISVLSLIRSCTCMHEHTHSSKEKERDI